MTENDATLIIINKGATEQADAVAWMNMLVDSVLDNKLSQTKEDK